MTDSGRAPQREMVSVPGGGGAGPGKQREQGTQAPAHRADGTFALMLVRRRIGSRRACGGPWRFAAVGVVMISLGLVSACGTAVSGPGAAGSGAARSLLRQTFSGTHTVRSGVLGFSLALTPSGSSTITGPITLGLAGPFQSRGAGRLPASNLEFTVGALGHRGQLGIISTGSRGYVTLGGAAYRLPAGDFQRLASSFSSAAAGGGPGGLAKLGINPLHWLTQPTIVGQDTVSGAATTHVHAHVDVAALLDDLNAFLHKAAVTGATGSGSLPGTISAATRQKVAAAVRHATVDVWTGSSDRALRKLSVNLEVPITGRLSSLLGGLSFAAINLTLQYAELNQPQTIRAPSRVRPFTEFTNRIRGIVSALQGAFGSGALGGSSTSGAAGAGSPSTPAGGALPARGYARCLQQSGGDVVRMQRCASLLSGGG